MKVADIQNKTRFGFDVWFGREKSRDISPNVFDTDTYINRNVKEWDRVKPGVINAPEQKLYRMTSRITLGNEFVKKYAVCPYNPLDNRSNTDSYSGTWTVRWERIEFPLDAEYIVTIATDDAATVWIGNRAGSGLKEIGNGLIDVQKGGDETILRKSLAQAGRADTPTTYRIKMKRGLYRIRTEVEQSNSGPLNPANPTYIAMKIELAPEFYDPNTVNQTNRVFYNSYIRSFSVRTIGKRSSCQTGNSIKRVVITNPGNGYLPAPNGEDEFGNQILDDGGDGLSTIERETVERDSTRDYVGCLTEIQVISTGIGYGPNDSVTVTPNIPGLNVRVQLTEQGQIVRMLVDNPACGVSVLPDITINSLTGSGAEFRPILEFTPLEEFAAARDTDPTEIIQVIDCV